jgi:hypothetical protein
MRDEATDSKAARLNDPFGRVQLPVGFTREDRIQMVGQAAEALLHGELPAAPARLFVAGALTAWLQRGGDLERDYFKVSAPAGSHRTPAALYALLARSDAKHDGGHDGHIVNHHHPV